MKLNVTYDRLLNQNLIFGLGEHAVFALRIVQ